MNLKQKIEELDRWIDNIFTIQNQLLEELGYEVKWRRPCDSDIYISKIDKSKTSDKE